MRCKPLIAGLFMAGLLAFTPASPAAAEAPVQAAPAITHARPALWVVRDRDTTIYLFGTIHMLKPEIRWFDGPVRRAFDRAQDVVLEVAERDEGDAQASLMQRAMQADGPTITSRLPDAARAKYLAALESHGLAPQLFDRVKPWFASLTLSVLPLRDYGYAPDNGADQQIKLAAIASGKTLVGLETSAEQIGFFETLPEPLQIAMLGQTLDELPTLGDTIARMIAAWSNGQPDTLAALMNESVDTNPELEKRLLTDRNDRWADWIKARLARPGVVFMAVGAGHLAGRNSVQEMLKKRGLTAVLIKRRD